MEGRRISRANVEYDIRGGYQEIEGLVTLLEEYENNRDIYPGIDSFLPQIKNYFEIYLNNL